MIIMLSAKTNDYKMLGYICVLVLQYINGDKTAAEQSDLLYNRLFEHLNSEFVPPIDREDLLALAQGLKKFFRLPAGCKIGEENLKLIKIAVDLLPTMKNNKNFKRNIAALRKKTELLPHSTVIQYEFYSDCLKVCEALERIYIKNSG